MTQLATRPIEKLPVGTAFSRFVIALASDEAVTKAQRWRDTPQVGHALELMMKAAVLPGTTTDSAWAAPLADSGISAEVLALMRGISIVGRLEPTMRRVPANTRVSRDITTVAIGDWVPETVPTPVGALSFDAITLPPAKVGVIVVMTEELLKIGGPTAEQTIRQGVLGALAATLDRLFLLPSLAAATGRPASITNGATAITSTGATAAAIATDLAAMVAAITTSGAGLTWIMKPTTLAHVAAALGAASDLPRTLHGLPVIVSATSPAQITLLDAAEILVADDGGFDVSIARDASVRMDSAPVGATVLTSLFQHNLIGVRAIRWISWLRARDGSVAYMTVAY